MCTMLCVLGYDAVVRYVYKLRGIFTYDVKDCRIRLCNRVSSLCVRRQRGVWCCARLTVHTSHQRRDCHNVVVSGGMLAAAVAASCTRH